MRARRASRRSSRKRRKKRSIDAGGSPDASAHAAGSAAFFAAIHERQSGARGGISAQSSCGEASGEIESSFTSEMPIIAGSCASVRPV